MFVCKKCDRNSQPREKPVRVVLETRKAGGTGYQIVSEADYCSNCALTTGPATTIMAAAFAKVAEASEPISAETSDG